MQNRSNSVIFTILMALFCTLCVTVAAQPPDFDHITPKDQPQVAKDQPIATASRNRNEINWQPKVEYDKLVLTVSLPNGEVFRQEFASGQAPQFKLVDAKGLALPDGSYNYELRLTPKIPSEVKAALKQAREDGNDADLEREFKKNGRLPGGEIVQTGSFLIAKGTVQVAQLEGSKKEASSRNAYDRSPGNAFDAQLRQPAGFRFLPAAIGKFDQVIPDDLIVQGSGCFGFDCVNNESFGFDTIRLKENNLRIKFEDTSVSPFPTNDWQLTANDSASGGANKFSIEDITGAKVPFTVTAGAATNSIFVDSTGRVGFRTSTPVLDVHVNTSNSPAHRLEQNSSGGFTAQTWDVAGNEANFFVRDVTGGSRLPFRIRPGAPTSSIDIAATGNVGIGTASPQSLVHVRTNTVNTMLLENSQASAAGAGAGIIGYSNDGAALVANDRLAFYLGAGFDGTAKRNAAGMTMFAEGAWSNGVFPSAMTFETTQSTLRTEKMRITGAGNIGIGVTNPTSPIQHSNGATLTAGGVWMNASSRALKTNIRNLSFRDASATLLRMNPVTFQYKANPAENHVGFIAEDVPELVAASDRKGLSPMDVVAVLTKVVQEQQQSIAQLQKRIAQLEKKKAK